MPLMMDDDMDIDDLFGDGAGLSMPARPPSKELIQKVDEMRKSACNQTVAWSRMGLVVAVNSSGFGLELHNIRCHPDDGSWDLSESSPIQQLNTNIEGGPFQHLSFSPTGNELAIIDAVGRISMVLIASAINKPHMIRPAGKDQVDHLHALAGCHWLNTTTHRAMLSHGPAVLDGNKYRYEHTQLSTSPNGPTVLNGPVHPIASQSAFICLTINGVLRLLFPQYKGSWQERHLEVESIVSSDDLITHAAFCSERNGTLLLAYATTNKQLRLVRVSIDWGMPTESKPGVAPLLNPRIETEHLAVGSWMTSEADEDINGKFSMSSASEAKSSMVYLSHLDVLPPIIERSGEISTPPTIIAVRSYLPPSSSNYNQEVYSTLDRWSFQESTQSLHSAFEQLSSRRNSIGSSTGGIYRQLKVLTCLTVDKIVISIQHFNLAKTLCIAYSDGSIEYRDRETLAETSQHHDGLQKLYHLSEAGFAYTDDEPCVQVAMSPTFCSAVQIDNEGKLKWKRLEYHFTEMAHADLQRTAVTAALTVCCANAIHYHSSLDDLLDIAFRSRNSPYLSFQTDLPPELARIFSLKVDYFGEQHHDALVRNSFLQSILSVQNSLGYSGDHKPRSFSGKYSWIAVHLRHAVVISSIASQYKTQGPNGTFIFTLEDPETVNSISGMIRWSLDLMAWLVDSLLQLRDAAHSSNYDLNALNKILHDTNIPSLHLLLSSASRGLLLAMSRRITHLGWVARNAISIPPQASTAPPALRSAYRNIANITSNALIKTADFEKLINNIDNSIKEVYSAANLTGPNPPISSARNAHETKLLLCFPLPILFKSVQEKLFKDFLPRILETLDDVGELYFFDFAERMGIDLEILEAKSGKGKRQMDTFYKRWIVGFGEVPGLNGVEASRIGSLIAVANANQNAFANANNTNNPNAHPNPGQAQILRPGPLRVRRCMRCASCMEDILVARPSNQWLISQQKRCACGACWNLLMPGKTVA